MNKKSIPVIKNRWYFVIVAAVLLLAGIASMCFSGFNKGIDFESGLGLKVQVAPSGLAVTYGGADNAQFSIASSTLSLDIRGANGVETHAFDAATYPTVADLAKALSAIDQISVQVYDGSLKTASILSGYGFPATLSESPTVLNFAKGGEITIDNVRNALSGLGNVRIQTVGAAADQVFQIRVGMNEGDTQTSMENSIKSSLDNAFGKDNVVILQSDYVGPKFSSSLLRGSIVSVLVALALILVYIWFRFRFAYAVSSIIALCHDVLLLLGFISVFKLEVSSTSVAALLTIIGYSLNNTIVIFDRVRENVKLQKDTPLDVIVDGSIAQSMSRTLMSSITTLLAILPLALLASGDIKLFAIEMMFGIVVGTYSSNFIAPVFFKWITDAQVKHKAEKQLKKA